MKVFIPKYSGFCPGVKFAEKSLFELRKKKKEQNISVLGELIHNRQYIAHLKEHGIGMKGSVDEFRTAPKSVAVIRTHGIARDSEADLRKGLEVLDLTCGKVKQLQKAIEQHSQKGYFIVITGKKNHPEMLGLISYAKDGEVIENEKALEGFITELARKVGAKKILVVSQTTGDRALFETAGKRIRETVGAGGEVKTIDSICSINTLREEEAAELQDQSDITIVIGDRISSNANKLFDILKESGKKTGQTVCFVTDLNELLKQGLDLKKFQSALVVSSSSTPDFIEKELVDHLLKI